MPLPKTSRREIPTSGSLAAATEPLLYFQPSDIARGIAFHLVDEKLADEVSLSALQRVMESLTRRAVELNISRAAWASMKHVQRLEWLMRNAAVTLTVHEDVAVLETAES